MLRAYLYQKSSSIQTVLSVSELHRFGLSARGLYRRSGIAPCPEVIFIYNNIPRLYIVVKWGIIW